MKKRKDDDDMLSKEGLERIKSRIRQKEFYDKMKDEGYKRQPVWLSPESQKLLKSCSSRYSKESTINEALELLSFFKAMFPDEQFCLNANEVIALRKLKARQIATERDNPIHWEGIETIKHRRFTKIASLFDTLQK